MHWNNPKVKYSYVAMEEFYIEVMNIFLYKYLRILNVFSWKLWGGI